MEDKNTNQKSEAALREEKVLEFWRENKIFEKSLAKESPKGEFVFYDGPVTANSKPVLHTMVPFSFKDVIPRYKTMRGYHVRRKGGWDTHGLPVELQVEKKLGLTSKKAIEEYGIAKFNRECRQSVWEYVGFWKDFTSRMGYWADQENPYVTYESKYIESLWSVVKNIDDKGLLFKDYKVVPWCPRCGTALSSHELALGYQDVKDLSVYAKFKIKGVKSGYFLAWTTTPWTLPGNVALAVGNDIDYVEVKVGEEILVLAKEKLSLITEPYEIVAEHKGSEMLGMEYEPLFPYFSETISGPEKAKLEKAYKVYAADFVNTEDGTGIVHTAVMYGQDDFVLGNKVGLPKHHLVGLDGKFAPGTGIFEGRFVRDEEVAVDIIKDLAHRGHLFKKEKYEHSYPHCWRCKTALIYYARDSWYVRMSDPKIKGELIEENKKINWEPSHIRDGRFGEWLREIKDWAISRERYWGTPLPVWMAADGEKIVVDSFDTLRKYVKKSGNKYFVMRHGGTEGNQKGIVSYKNEKNDHLTEKGKEEVLKSAKNLKDKKIDLIVTSPFARTKKTAEIVRESLGLLKDAVVEENGLHEVNPGLFDGKNWDEYHKYVYDKSPGWFTHRIPGGESLAEVKKRTAKVLYELESKYKNKNILLVTHGGPAWLLFVNSGQYEPENKEYHPANTYVFVKEFKRFQNAEVRPLPFVPVPHDEEYNLDPHRPYIDEIVLEKDGKEFKRVKEVMDVWFDSGGMPFAQDHYPFDLAKPLYPADFISEGIDQTRGWFYTLHAVGVLMGFGKAFKNVICLGHLLDAKGKKMSKSVGNVVDPWEMMDKYGVDALRMWMYSVNQPGESKNFDEKTVALLNQQVFGLFYNVLAFYELYRDRSFESSGRPKSNNVLDRWIVERLDRVTQSNTEYLDQYKLLEPARALRDFVQDLSTWYLRRSRERIKDGDREAKETLYYVLKTFSKLLAPLAPFTAEDVWLRLKNEHDKESVHLADWPKTPKNLLGIFGGGKKVLVQMEEVREICNVGNRIRKTSNMPIRQPLAKLYVPQTLPKEYEELVKDELNVKEVVQREGEISFDQTITPELKAEGEYREFMRTIQDRRKQLGLKPGDKMPLTVEEIYKIHRIMPSLQLHMLRVAAVASIICDSIDTPVDKQNIVLAELFHDMGNIIKSKFDVFPEFCEPEGVAYWASVKEEFKDKYGKAEHEVNKKIMEEIGLPAKAVFLADQNQFSLLCNHLTSNDMDVKITHYADGRVGPYGVLSYHDRMEEGRVRYHGKDGEMGGERQRLVNCGKEIEKQIFSHCKIKPEDITDEAVAPVISELRKFVIK